ncbi:Uncharacterised protein [uncultured archaeon]|nr:Uncharacterised protein [uncultured archaeon]
MAQLVALLSKGEGTWGQVSGLIKRGEWEKIIVIGDTYAKNFMVEGAQFDFVEADLEKPLVALKQELTTKLKPKLDSDFSSEVSLSIASGTGKEHMALVSALLAIPVGVRFTALTKDGIVFL